MTTTADQALSGIIASADAASRRVAVELPRTQQIRGLGRVQAARPPVQPREVLTGRRLADAQLACGSRDRSGHDVGAQDLELASRGLSSGTRA